MECPPLAPHWTFLLRREHEDKNAHMKSVGRDQRKSDKWSKSKPSKRKSSLPELAAKTTAKSIPVIPKKVLLSMVSESYVNDSLF